MKTLSARSFIIFLALGTFLACHKNGSPGMADILASHSWHAYQTEVKGADTIIRTTFDSTGQGHDTIVAENSFDTIIILDPCVQQSTFSFKSNGVLVVSDACSANPTSNNNWSMTSAVLNSASIMTPNVNNYIQQLLYSGVSGDTTHGVYFTSGPITEINNSEFIYNYGSSYNSERTFNGSNIETVKNIRVAQFTTYKSQ